MITAAHWTTSNVYDLKIHESGENNMRYKSK